MRLDSSAFLVVFALFFVLHTLVPARHRRVLLVAGSTAFYATFGWRFVPLLLALGLVAFYAGRAIDRFFWIGIALCVSVLFFFKVGALFEIAQPLGVAFFTLQGISYLVDIQRRSYAPPKSLLSFLASFTLFPHLLSGPIVRSSFLVPLVERAEDPTWTAARRALLLFVAGFVKKAIADKLAVPANLAFDATQALSTLDAWTGLLAYAGQLYGDFSGYTDMATALALLLGLDLPANFNLPYLATSPADFWRRWHISLSTWLRDYVYLPLGIRFRRWRYTTLVVTWILAGLWHGLRWPFLVYGLYHGILLALTAAASRRFAELDEARGVRRVVQTAVTFYLVLMGYVLFRAPSLGAAGRYFAALHTSRVPSVVSHDAVVTVEVSVLALVFCHALDFAVLRGRRVVDRHWVVWPAMAVAVACLALFRGTAQPFIYFSF